jgi:hypothetical protein
MDIDSSNIFIFNIKNNNYFVNNINNFNIEELNFKKGIYILQKNDSFKIGSTQNLKERLKTYKKNENNFEQIFNFYIYQTNNEYKAEIILLTLLSQWRINQLATTGNGKYFLSENIHNIHINKLIWIFEYVVYYICNFKINFSIPRSINSIKDNLNKMINTNNNILNNLLEIYISNHNYDIPIPMDIDKEYKKHSKFNYDNFIYYINNSLI